MKNADGALLMRHGRALAVLWRRACRSVGRQENNRFQGQHGCIPYVDIAAVDSSEMSMTHTFRSLLKERGRGGEEGAHRARACMALRRCSESNA